MKIFFIAIFITVFFNFKSIYSQNQNEVKTIEVDVDGPVGSSVLDIADIVQVIKLETTAESMIGTIERMLYHSGRFYILDSKRKQVKLFSEDGKFLGNIGKNGKGPKEYVDPGDIAFSYDRKYFAILDGDISRTILYYDLDGNFVNRIKLPHYFSRFQMISKDRFILYKDNASFDGELYNIYTINGDGEVISKDFGFDEKMEGLNYLTHNILYEYRGITNIVLPFNPSVYVVENDQIEPYINLDFGRKSMTEEDYITLFEKSNNNLHGFNRKVEQSDKVFSVSSFARNKDWIYFIYYQGDDEFGLYYNLSSGETYRYNLNSISDFYNRLVPGAHMGSDKFINVLYPYLLKSRADHSFRLKFLKKNYPQAYEQYKNELSNLKIDDNPVLLITRLKE